MARGNFIILLHLFCACVLLNSKLSMASTTGAPSARATRHQFAADLYEQIAKDNSANNIVFSPISIQSCLVLAFFGAEGETADELRNGLHLGVADKRMVAQTFGNFVRDQLSATADGADKDERPTLRMANRMYVNAAAGELAPDFERLVGEHFDTQAERLPFGADAAGAVQKINGWVEEQTEHKIKDLLQADAVDGDTSALLINAIYFKGKWRTPFSLTSTHKSAFAVTANEQIEVDMMSMDDTFRYAELPELNAKALELPYNNSDLSMLLILPNEANGLQELEQQLVNLELNRIEQHLQTEDVLILLPKFRIELDLDLKRILQQLGMKQMFSDRADFSGLFASSQPQQRVSDARHKAYLDVNEAGSEAAAATYLKIVPMSLNLDQKVFNADHPFVFVIRNSEAIFFVGHVVRPQ